MTHVEQPDQSIQRVCWSGHHRRDSVPFQWRAFRSCTICSISVPAIELEFRSRACRTSPYAVSPGTRSSLIIHPNGWFTLFHPLHSMHVHGYMPVERNIAHANANVHAHEHVHEKRTRLCAMSMRARCQPVVLCRSLQISRPITWSAAGCRPSGGCNVYSYRTSTSSSNSILMLGGVLYVLAVPAFGYLRYAPDMVWRAVLMEGCC